MERIGERQTDLGRQELGMTAVIHEMIALKCAGLITSGITASQKPCHIHNVQKIRETYMAIYNNCN